MSLNPEAAFNKILSLQARTVTLDDLETNTQISISAAPSNYFRHMAGPEETFAIGREFVVSKKNLSGTSLPLPKRGMRIIDSELGNNTIIEVREMIILGTVVGYRLRTD